jgi:hypothetical protein
LQRVAAPNRRPKRFNQWNQRIRLVSLKYNDAATIFWTKSLCDNEFFANLAKADYYDKVTMREEGDPLGQKRD